MVTTVQAVVDPSWFACAVAVWLWATVLFANMAEAVAEGRGKAQAATLRATRKTTTAERRLPDGSLETVAASDLTIGDLVVVRPNEIIPGDGDVVEGMATVDESAITGESAPVIRESGGDRSAVTGGTTVLSDGITVRITTKPGETFIDRMIALVEGASRQKTPNEIALTILLTVLTIIFLLAVMAMQPMAIYSGQAQSPVVLVALLVCLIPTTIGALLSAIGIAGMDRLVQHNVLAMSGRAVEAAGDVSTLLLDKTGTITFGNRRATELLAAPAASAPTGSPGRHISPRSRTRRPRGAPSSSWRRRRSTRPRAEALDRAARGRARPSSSSAPRPGCRASTCPTARPTARGQPTRSRAGWRASAATMPSGVLTEVDGIATSGGTPLVVAVQRDGPTGLACSASSTSRTSSSPA